MEQSERSLEKRYPNFLQALGTYVPIAGLVASIGYVVVFIVTGAWQMLVAAIIAVLGAFLFITGRIIVQRRHYWAAALIMLATGSTLVPAFGLVWSGISPALYLAAWIVPIVIVLFGIQEPLRRVASIPAGITATLLIALVEVFEPLARIYILDLKILIWFVPFVTFLGGSLLLVLFLRAILVRRLLTRVLGAFLLIVLVPVLTLSTTSIINGFESDRRFATNIVSSIADKKELEIQLWVDGLQSDLGVIIDNDNALTQIIYLLSQTGSVEPFRNAVLVSFSNQISQTGRLEEMMLMNEDGIVVASSNPGLNGWDAQYEDYFWRGKNELFVTPPFLSEDTNEMSVVVSRPVTNRAGQIIGVIAGRATIQGLIDIVAAPSGLVEGEFTYLVNVNYDVLEQDIHVSPTIETRSQAAVDAVLYNRSAFLEDYVNFAGTQTVGAYRWLPNLKLALITEQPTAIALQNVQNTIASNSIIALISGVIAILGAYFTMRSVTVPLSTLSQTAQQITAGNFNLRVDIEQEDEIGALATMFNNMASQLLGLITGLEERVAERTKDLDRRTTELQITADIARDATSARTVDDLLSRAARLIFSRFGYYHVGIFLVDEKGEYAILHAAGGEAGRLMIANNHRLRVGEVGIVGHVAKTGESRIALDTDIDGVHFRNPMLPYTRSEMTLPLVIGDRVIGILDIQSEKTNAFDDNSIATMQTLSDQLAIAIERTRLLQEVESSVAQMENTFKEYTVQTWRTYLRQAALTQGYRFAGTSVEPTSVMPKSSEEAFTKGKPVITYNTNTRMGGTLSVPILLRGQILGVLGLKFQSREIPDETINVVVEAANRLAMALENARLVQDAQRLALRERQINVISTQVQRSTDLETIMQDTIRELGDMLGVPRTFIQIGISSNQEQGKVE
ncbi:MAG: GAF domain-containing protein [Chloroflexota bacterium]